MREAGITDIWLPPPSASVAREGYLPTRLYNLDSAYGSHKDLRALLRALQVRLSIQDVWVETTLRRGTGMGGRGSFLSIFSACS